MPHTSRIESAVISLVLLSLSQISVARTKATEVNCLRKKVQKRHASVCPKVIDPMKYRRGEIAYLDCTAELEDGYAAGLCEHVDVREQKKLRDQIKSADRQGR